MGLSTDLISQFVRNTNDSEKKKEEIVVYGTVTSDGERYYVQIDGSSESTPINTTTEVNVGDRVLVTVKNHTATITGNITDPAVGTKRAGNIESSIKQTADSISIAVKSEVDKLSASLTVDINGIRTEVTDALSGFGESISKIEQTANGISSTVETHYNELTAFKGTVNSELSGVKSSISTIEQTASSITATVSSNHGEFTTFKQTLEGFAFMGKNGTVKIDGGSINLTGSIAFSDFDSDTQTKIDTASTNAKAAAAAVTNLSSDVTNLSTNVNNIQYTAGQALTQAQSASEAAAIAQQLASNVQLPSYLKSTYIDQTLISSPTIIGGAFYAIGQSAWTTMSSDGLRIYTGSITQPKIELINVGDVTELTLGSGTNIGSTTMGRFIVTKQKDKVVMRYYSGINEYLSCGLVLYDNGKIELRRDYTDTNYPSRTTKLTLIEGI